MRVVRIATEVGQDSLIDTQTFEGALIVGPAMLAPLDDVTIEGCQFQGDEESLFLVVPAGRRVLGVIGLRHTTFRRCEFHNIALIGTAESIATFRQGFEYATRQPAPIWWNHIEAAPPPPPPPPPR